MCGWGACAILGGVPRAKTGQVKPMNEHYEQWSRLSPIGLLVIGAGASMIGHAATLKGKNKGFWGWFLMGSLGLIVLNAGVSIFGEAVKHRSLYEVQLYELIKKK